MKIATGSVVRLDYELRFKGGDVIESSNKTGPVEYVQGQGKLLPALERRLEGLTAGATLEGEIPAEEITPVESLPTKIISRSEFPPGAQIEVRGQYEANTATGPVRLYVVAVDDKHITAKLLPPLAGRDIAFKVKIVMVEDPITHKRTVVVKKPPPVPGEALHLELEPDDS